MANFENKIIHMQKKGVWPIAFALTSFIVAPLSGNEKQATVC